MKIKKAYKVVPHPTDFTPGAWAVEVQQRPYKGVVVSFGEVKLIPDHEKDICTFNYQRYFHFVPRHVVQRKWRPEELQEFEKLLAEILGDVLDDYLAQNPKS